MGRRIVEEEDKALQVTLSLYPHDIEKFDTLVSEGRYNNRSALLRKMLDDEEKDQERRKNANKRKNG